MKQIALIILGAGGVGQALLRQIVDGRTQTLNRAHCRFNIIAIADSRTWQFQPGGLDDGQLRAIIAAKQAGKPVGERRPSTLEILNAAHEANPAPHILVDVTAESGMEPALDRALALGWGVAMANKKALAAPWQTAQAYFNQPQIRHESTVGGGQPVIATLRCLLDTGDPIYEIEGQLSGTLGFICQQLDQDAAFSAAIAAAKTNGFTEPDPRQDLGGQDVMRKALILGRMAGWPLAAADIQVESLYPAQMAALSAADFMAQSLQLDDAMRQRVVQARQNGQVLRYVARVDEKGGRVGLQALPAGSPLANMKYTSFCTGRYADEPLLIGGKGAGVEMTAAGVLGDMIALVREMMP